MQFIARQRIRARTSVAMLNLIPIYTTFNTHFVRVKKKRKRFLCLRKNAQLKRLKSPFSWTDASLHVAQAGGGWLVLLRHHR